MKIIYKDVPAPESWPFAQMEPGDSLLIAKVTDDPWRRSRARGNAWAAAKTYMRKHPDVKLIVRVDREHHIRCWRIS